MKLTKKYMWGVTGLIIGGVFLYLAIQNINGQKLVATLKNARIYYFLPYALLTLTFFWLKAVRWKNLLNEIKIYRSYDLFGPIMIGFGFNNILPFRIGELIRIYVFAKHTGLSNYTVLSSIGLERLESLVEPHFYS